jgi:hypothetical protein
MDNSLSDTAVGAEVQESENEPHFGVAAASVCLIGEPPGGNWETHVPDWKMQIYRLIFYF